MRCLLCVKLYLIPPLYASHPQVRQDSWRPLVLPELRMRAPAKSDIHLDEDLVGELKRTICVVCSGVAKY